jgi:hypothetical protein
MKRGVMTGRMSPAEFPGIACTYSRKARVSDSAAAADASR